MRASASIPFFFEPVTLRSATRQEGQPDVSTLVDGSVLSNFPIALFDRTDDQPPRWPTFGVRLTMRPDGRVNTTEVRGTVSLALSLVETMLEACDGQHIDDPCVQARSIFVDTSGISPVDFGITDEQQEQLLLAGHQAAGAFLADWDWTDYLAPCRGVRGGRRDEDLAAVRRLAAAAAACPTGMQADVFEGFGQPPASIGEVEFFVMPYLAGTAPARLMAGMPSLRVAQTLTAGVDDVRPLVPDGVTLCNAQGRARRVDRGARRGPRAGRAARDPGPRAGRRARVAGRTRRDRRWPTAGCCSWATARSGQAVERRLAGFECEVRRVARRAPGR